MSYNKTQLNPDTTFERHVYHRDQFAHYLRWTHVLRYLKPNSPKTILDVGCGSGNLCELLYRNRQTMHTYTGVDIRPKTIQQAKEKYEKLPWAKFVAGDVCGSFNLSQGFDLVTCFEVLEHVGKENAEKVLRTCIKHMESSSILLLSTPCYDPSVGAANNHMIDGEVGEFTYAEMSDLIQQFFTIEQHWGTFASIKDYKHLFLNWHKQMYQELAEYYDTNLLSVIMAPFFPDAARNVLWKLRLK